jgi:hypothetical protein
MSFCDLFYNTVSGSTILKRSTKDEQEVLLEGPEEIHKNYLSASPVNLQMFEPSVSRLQMQRVTPAKIMSVVSGFITQG